ncbi:hypothetical protein [Streptomyces sp. NPDC087300]|uniref:hypothetical protein n=1 Tax=Streptomyces sp. NPDC087300 TaxID=3365780 RepID=UPI0038175EC6
MTDACHRPVAYFLIRPATSGIRRSARGLLLTLGRDQHASRDASHAPPARLNAISFDSIGLMGGEADMKQSRWTDLHERYLNQKRYVN